jgi:transcriptional regulator with XRE-family HTH domain
MARSFGEILREMIEAKGWTLREFARRSRTNNALLSRVIRGQRQPPAARLEGWATALELTGSERQEFIEQGRLALCPPEIVALVRQLRAENARLRGK